MIAGVAVLFLAIGHDSLASSSRAVLHGLCAQRPSHSFTVGGEVLPFDARMTGIYSGSLWTWALLAFRGRLLAARTPAPAVIVALAIAVGALAVDGVNALLVDLTLWHPYEPMNVVRFFTGFGTGIALATLEVWLIGGALWKLASPEMAPWERARDLWWALPASVGTIGVILTGGAWLYPVLAYLLLVSAWVTVTGLTLVIVVSLFRIERRIGSVDRLDGPLVVSALAALLVIVGLAQLRFWLERTLGIPQDFMATVGPSLASILS